jgi:transposase
MAKVKCPKCHFSKLWKLSDGRRKCQRCLAYFTPLPLEFHLSWYQINHLVEYFSLGVPVYRLRHIMFLSRPTMEKFFRFLRQLIYDESVKELEKLSGKIEIDETMFGGKDIPGKKGWGASGKQVVFGIYQRNGKVITMPISSRGRNTLIPLILKHTKHGSMYYTDDWFAYTSLDIIGNHVVVKKEKGQPKGRNHLNGMEGFWSYAKHWLYQYRGVPKQYFHLYLKEVEFRFNHRNENIIPLIKHIIKEQIGADI